MRPALIRFSIVCLACFFTAGPSNSGFAATVRVSKAPFANRLQAGSGIDYGSFSVVEVDDATADRLVQTGAGERLDDAHRIFLNAETLDTTTTATQGLRQAGGDFTGKHLHLVQFAGPIKQEWVDALVADGLRIVTYIPNNAYLVWGEAHGVANLQGRAADVKSAVQWEGSWRDEWKVAPRVLGSAKEKLAPAEKLSVQLVEDKDTNAATLAALQAAGATFIRKPRANLGYLNFVVRLASENLGVLTSQPDVVSIHRYEQPRKLDESQDMVLAGNLSGNIPNPGDYLTTLATWGFTQDQFDTSGLVVDVSDDGIDNGTTTPNHFVLYRNGNKSDVSRLVYRVTQGTGGTDNGMGKSGHGQLNATIIGGFVPTGSVTVNGNTTSTTTFPHADAQGFRYGLGIAPFVRLGNSTIFDPDPTNFNYNTLQSDAYGAGARISSNSWGFSPTAGAYDSDAQSYDALVRDAQIGTSGNQQMVIVFAAGNDGSAAQTVDSPSTAKNVITVGAAEGVRSEAIDAGGLDGSGTDGSNVTNSGANSPNDIISFSSRGPCADGRVKPDLVAGGTHITGMTFVTPDSTQDGTADPNYRADGVSGLVGNTGTPGQAADFFPTVNDGSPPYNQAQQWWTTSSGTSHSCPAVTGAAALIFQQFLNNPGYLAANRTPAGPAPPSPALVKAYLMNSTRYMTGNGATGLLPSNSQGMGHANLGMAFDGVSRIIRDQSASDRFTATGQTRNFIGTITDTSKPFRVTLAWTDAVGPTAGNAYVNDLDLTVTVGGNTYKGNVFAGSGGFSVTGGLADPRDNVESVFLPAGTSGTFSITITASNIAGIADPTIANNNQDFALVVYNGNSTNSAVLSNNVPVIGGNGLVPNDCNTLSIPLLNTGTADATALSAVLSTSTPGVTVTQPNSTYPDMAVGATASNNTPFQISTASSMPCNTTANFTLTVTYSGSASPFIYNFPLRIGDPNYAFTASSGASIPPGGTLVTGSQQDDALASITTPADFAFRVYDTNVPGGSTILASTNGNLQIAATGGTNAYTNGPLPVATPPPPSSQAFGAFPANLPTIFVYWDDAVLNAPPASNGIYTSLTGSAPNRIYTIEWRGSLFVTPFPTVDFAVLFHENSSTFDLVYQNAAAANGASATIGVQAASTGSQFTQYSFNTASISSGTKLTATLPACSSGSGPCQAAPAITSTPPPSPVILGSPYTYTFTATGSPAPTFTITSGTLPTGLNLSAGGVLSGTATSAGTGFFPNITVTASNGIAPDATQTFDLTVVTRLANYISSFGLTGSDALPLADPNGDGVSNLLAYALNFDPTANNGNFERGMLRNYGGQNYLSIRFNRSALATDLTYIVEATEDLTGTWTELAHSTAGGALTATGGVVVSDSGGPPIYLDEVRDTVAVPPTPSDPQRFIRLRVTSP